jgi:hypothetical protein
MMGGTDASARAPGEAGDFPKPRGPLRAFSNDLLQ